MASSVLTTTSKRRYGAHSLPVPTIPPATNGPSWGGPWGNVPCSGGWLGSDDPCTGDSWYGVECTPLGEVVGLDLDMCELDGTVPTELGYLTSLNGGQDANQNSLFYYNYLAGTVPTEIGRWTAFQEKL